MKVLSVRLDEEIERKLGILMEKLKIIDKSTYIRQLLEKSLSEELLRLLCKEVGEKQISAWKAAEIAGISLRKMLYKLKEYNTSGIDEISLKEDIKFALE